MQPDLSLTTTGEVSTASTSDTTEQPTQSVYDLKLTDNSLSELIRKRRGDADSHWERKYKLKSKRTENKKLYTSEYVLSQPRELDAGPLAVDNRLFVAVRVLTPYIVDRLAQPEVTPADADDLSRNFAKDFERVLAKEAKNAGVKEKFRLMVQDLFEGQRKGVGKWHYNSAKKCLEFKRLDPKNVLVSHRSELYDEPDFIDEMQKRTIGDLFKLFPAKKDQMKRDWGITLETPMTLDKEQDIYETWLFVDDSAGDRKLAVVWSYGVGSILGAATDPNYDYGSDANNILDEPVTPYVFVNFLNDGSGYEDETSFIEQAQYSQKSYDRDAQTISDDAAWGGSGVPVVAKGALEQDDDLAKLKFSPSQRLVLDAEDMSKAFTTWNKPALDKSIFDNKLDQRNNVDNTFGTPSIFRGEQTDANTLGQDVILRDQAQGRQTDIITAVDSSMRRSLQIEAQLMGRFFDDEQYYKFVGDDGKFIKVMMSSARIAQNAECEIDVEEGSSLPVDRGQKRAVLLQLLQLNKIGTLTAYRQLGIDDPEEAFKEYMEEQVAPQDLMAKVDKDTTDRDAEEDLYIVIGGKVPEERDDVTPEYVSYLNNWLLTEKYNRLKPNEQQAVSAYVQMVIAKAQLKIAKMASQLPPPTPATPPAIGPDGQPLPPDPNAPPQGSQPPQGQPSGPPPASPLPEAQGGTPPEAPTPGLPVATPPGVIG